MHFRSDTWFFHERDDAVWPVQVQIVRDSIYFFSPLTCSCANKPCQTVVTQVSPHRIDVKGLYLLGAFELVLLVSHSTRSIVSMRSKKTLPSTLHSKESASPRQPWPPKSRQSMQQHGWYTPTSGFPPWELQSKLPQLALQTFSLRCTVEYCASREPKPCSCTIFWCCVQVVL